MATSPDYQSGDTLYSCSTPGTSPDHQITKSNFSGFPLGPQFAILLTTLIWGATFPATKAALLQVPPMTFLVLRFILGTILVFAVLVAVGRRIKADAALLRLSAIATVFLFLGYALQTVGLRYTSASNSAFITALYVVFVPLFLRRFAGRVWLSAGLALAGLWLLVDPSVSLNIGDLMTLACAAAFAAHISCLEFFLPRTDPVSLFFWQMLFATVAMLPTPLWEDVTIAQLAPTPVLLGALLITGVLATGAFAVQMWAQQLIPAQRVALIFSMEPAFAAWLAWYVLGERLEVQAWIGSALILIGVVVGAMQATPADAIARGVGEHG